jgi:hypothetical protein
MKRFAPLVVVATIVGCNYRPPLVADMTCPTDTALEVDVRGGACVLPLSRTKHGPAYVIDPGTGQMTESMVYSHGVLDGSYVRYGTDGRAVLVGTYRNGKRDGLWTAIEPDGGRTESDWADDAQVGKSRRYDPDGAPLATTPPNPSNPPAVPPPVPPIVPPVASAKPPEPAPKPGAPRSDVDEMAAEAAQETKVTGLAPSLASVRVLRFEADLAFDAHTAWSPSSGGFASGSVGAVAHVGVPLARLAFKGDHYSGVFFSIGGTGSFGESLRSDSCGGPCAAGDGRWGERWLLGPYARVGYARSHDARATGAVRSFFAYAGVAPMFGEDRWALLDGTRTSALLWRVRVSAGYTAPRLFPRLAESLRDAKKGEDLLLTLALVASVLFEHGELFVDFGGDRGAAITGLGIGLGFGL